MSSCHVFRFYSRNRISRICNVKIGGFNGSKNPPTDRPFYVDWSWKAHSKPAANPKGIFLC